MQTLSMTMAWPCFQLSSCDFAWAYLCRAPQGISGTPIPGTLHKLPNLIFFYLRFFLNLVLGVRHRGQENLKQTRH